MTILALAPASRHAASSSVTAFILVVFRAVDAMYTGRAVQSLGCVRGHCLNTAAASVRGLSSVNAHSSVLVMQMPRV